MPPQGKFNKAARQSTLGRIVGERILDSKSQLDAIQFIEAKRGWLSSSILSSASASKPFSASRLTNIQAWSRCGTSFVRISSTDSLSRNTCSGSTIKVGVTLEIGAIFLQTATKK